MGRWTAKCWLGSSAGYQDLEVSANTLNGAKQQLQRVYGAQQIINLHEVRESRSGGGDGGGSEISWTAIGLIFLAVIFLAYWWIIIPVGILGGIGLFFFVRGND